jgi:exonuclease SbcD
MREIKGPIAELLRVGEQNTGLAQDYLHATLTDEDEVYDAIGQLRVVYPNLMHLDFENSRTTTVTSKTAASGDVARKTPMELFAEFYQNQNNTELTEEQRRMMTAVFAQAGGED